ncbi:hypothetical protein H0H93_011094 [Arthromyces matolae]|nr:hypothetical protein H0H93_011094 [Arthromyces matolae]
MLFDVTMIVAESSGAAEVKNNASNVAAPVTEEGDAELKAKAAAQRLEWVADALRTSSFLEVDDEGKRVRRVTESQEPKGQFERGIHASSCFSDEDATLQKRIEELFGQVWEEKRSSHEANRGYDIQNGLIRDCGRGGRVCSESWPSGSHILQGKPSHAIANAIVIGLDKGGSPVLPLFSSAQKATQRI